MMTRTKTARGQALTRDEWDIECLARGLGSHMGVAVCAWIRVDVGGDGVHLPRASRALVACRDLTAEELLDPDAA